MDIQHKFVAMFNFTLLCMPRRKILCSKLCEAFNQITNTKALVSICESVCSSLFLKYMSRTLKLTIMCLPSRPEKNEPEAKCVLPTYRQMSLWKPNKNRTVTMAVASSFFAHDLCFKIQEVYLSNYLVYMYNL